MRTVDARELTHERLGDRFATSLSNYDTQRRLEVLVDSFFPGSWLQGKAVLDVGCGLGFFSERLQERGAVVTACDIGSQLVEHTGRRVGCNAQVADALSLEAHFGRSSFDAVVSSECIEHTPDPARAMRQMCAVLKPGGVLSLSTPNWVWWPLVKFATVCRLRPFDGFENFSSFRSLRRVVREEGLEVQAEVGLHLFPFQLRAHRLLRWCDSRCQPLRSLMINLCLRAQKPLAPGNVEYSSFA